MTVRSARALRAQNGDSGRKRQLNERRVCPALVERVEVVDLIESDLHPFACRDVECAECEKQDPEIDDGRFQKHCEPLTFGRKVP